MNIWFGKNKVMSNISIGDTSNLDKTSDFDMSFDSNEKWNTMEVFLGENGVGKSFIGKVISYFAYIHANYNAPQNLNTSKVANALRKMGFGNKDESSPILILSSIDESDGFGSFWGFKIGASAKAIFDKYSVIFYSNSQFPSNEVFFSSKASALNAMNVDVAFWHILKSIKTPNLQVCYGIDADAVRFREEDSFFNFSKNREIDDNESFDSMYYGVNKQIFDNICVEWCYWRQLKESIVAKTLKKNAQDGVFEKKTEDISSLEVKDYLAVLFLQKKYSDIYFELVYNSVPWSVLNSYSRYKLVLECLENMTSDNVILFVDEPENSMHLSIQKMIAEEIPKNCKCIAMTHSPEFVSALLSNKENDSCKINHLFRDEENIVKCSVVDPNSIASSLDAIAAELFGVSPNYDKWIELNPNPVDSSFLTAFNDFYDDLKNMDVE